MTTIRTLIKSRKPFSINALLAARLLEPLESRQLLSITTPVPLTNESTIFSDPQGPAYGQDIIALPDGSSVVTWLSSDGDGLGIFAARVDSSGKQIGQTIPVNTYTQGYQLNPSIAPRSGGGFVIAWDGQTASKEFGVQAQIFDSQGNKIGPAITAASDSTPVNQFPDAFLLPDSGDFILTWASTGNDGHNGVHARRYDPNGGLVINATFNVNQDGLASDIDTIRPMGSALNDGSYVIAWRSVDNALLAQRFDEFSDFSGSNVTLVNSQSFVSFPSALAALPAGGLAVAWAGAETSTDEYDIYVQRFNNSLSPAGIPTLVNTFTDNHQTNPSIAAMPDSGFVIAWNSFDQDGDTWGAYGQSFDANAIPRGSEFQINQETKGVQGNPIIASYPNGRFAVAFSSQPVFAGDTTVRYFEGFHVNQAPTVKSFLGNPVNIGTIVDQPSHYDLEEVFLFNPGPGETDQSLLRYEVLTTDFVRYLDQPTISANGTLSFTTAQNAVGKTTFTVRAYDNGGTDFGGVDFVEFQFSLNILRPNLKPSLTGPDFIQIIEDHPFTVLDQVFTFDPGAPEESDQTAQYILTGNSNPALFNSPPSVDPNGNLTIDLAPNAVGSASVTFVVQDSGETDNGGINTSDPFSFVLTINPVNDAPSFFASDPPAISEDSGLQTIHNWATFNPGAPSESDQTAKYSVSMPYSDPSEYFTVPPSVSPDGTLTYQLVPNASGALVFSVTVSDSGPVGPFEVNVGNTMDFSIFATPVNDAPSFKANPIPAVDENSGPITLSKWATGTPGPADESSQGLTYTVSSSNPSLFAIQPAIGPNGTLTYTPSPNASGTATLSVFATDSGGTSNAGKDTSAIQTFTLTVNHVPHPIINVASTLPNLGNGVADGALTPLFANGTNFGLSYQQPGTIIRTFTVNNPGDQDLKISNFSLPAGFTLAEPLSSVIAQGKSDTFTIYLDTNVPGVFAGEVQFNTNASNASLFNFALAGTVQAGEFHTFTSKTAAKDRTFIDDQFNKVTFALTGPGTGKIFIAPDGSFKSLALTDTLAASSSLNISLTKTKAAASGFTSLTAIDITGGLSSFSGKQVSLAGSFNASANIKTLNLADVGAHQQSNIIIQGTSADKTTMTFGSLSEVSIRTDAVITSFRATQWLDSNGLEDELVAASLGSMNISGRKASSTGPAAQGDMQANIQLTLPIPATPRTKIASISSITIAGSSVGTWALGNHKLSSVNIAGTATGDVSATTIGTFKVDGDAHILSINSSQDLTSFSARHAQDVNLHVQGAIGTTGAKQWSGGTIHAGKLAGLAISGLANPNPRIKAPILAGNFDGNLIITGLSTAANAQTLGSVNINGSVIGDGQAPGLNSDWSITGGVGAIRINGSSMGLVFETKNKGLNKGNVTSITIVGQTKDTSFDIAGSTGAVTLGSSDNASLLSVGNIASFTGKQTISGTKLQSEGAIGAVVVASWQSGSIKAAKVASIVAKGVASSKGISAIAGDFSGQVDITGAGQSAKAVLLGSVGIAGALTGFQLSNNTWTIAGKTGAITVGHMQDTSININGNLDSYTSKLSTDTSALFVTGSIGAITAQQWQESSITAARVSTITTKLTPASGLAPAKYGGFSGNVTLTGNGLTAGTILVTSVTIAGELSSSNWLINGGAGRFTVGSSLNSSIFVGVSDKIGTLDLPGQDAHFKTYAGKRATLAGFAVTGANVPAGQPSFFNSRIAAGTITTISLKRVSAADSSPFGIVAADKIGAYSRLTAVPTPASTLKLPAKTTASIYDTLGSYTLKIVD
jgi:hypothetical protein